jgi:hypothetical protein
MLERACKSQMMVEACGGARHVSTDQDAEAKKERLSQQCCQVFGYLIRKVSGYGPHDH